VSPTKLVLRYTRNFWQGWGKGSYYLCSESSPPPPAFLILHHATIRTTQLETEDKRWSSDDLSFLAHVHVAGSALLPLIRCTARGHSFTLQQYLVQIEHCCRERTVRSMHPCPFSRGNWPRKQRRALFSSHQMAHSILDHGGRLPSSSSPPPLSF